MGTLGNQPERKIFHINPDEINAWLCALIGLANEHNIPIETVIAMHDVLVRKQANEIAVQDGNYRDEHMAGIGEAIGSIAAALHDTKVELRDALDASGLTSALNGVKREVLLLAQVLKQNG